MLNAGVTPSLMPLTHMRTALSLGRFFQHPFGQGMTLLQQPEKTPPSPGTTASPLLHHF